MRNANPIPRIKEFPNDGRIWRVDWFGGLERNHQVPTEPKIQVIISPAKPGISDFTANRSYVEEEQKVITIGTGQLPAITIGSLWQNKHCLPQTAGITHQFSGVNISAATVEVVRANTVVSGDLLIRKLYHRIGIGLSSFCLAIEWQNDPYGILISAIEVIRFYYATSTRLAKAIYRGDFRHSLQNVVNPTETGFDPQMRRAYLKLRKEFSDADAWIIGRILFTAEALAGANLVHDSMLKAAVQGKSRFYPEAAFPFTGVTDLRARVKRMKTADGHWRYIVFALEHCTGAFPFDKLICDRDNSNLRAPPDTDLPNTEKAPAFPARKPIGLQDPLQGELQSDAEPSLHQQSTLLALPEERFGAIADITLEKPEKAMCHYFSAGAVVPLGEPTDVLGTGDGTFAENDVTPTQLITHPLRQAALPASFENFESMVRELNRLPDFSAALRPRTSAQAFIPLLKPAMYRQWSYLNSERMQRRHVVIADVLHQRHPFCLIEFE